MEEGDLVVHYEYGLAKFRGIQQGDDGEGEEWKHADDAPNGDDDFLFDPFDNAEWMPVRDPVPGRAKEAMWRKFDIGELATLFLLETRLVGRSEELTFDELFMAPDAERPAIATALKAKIADPQRTLMGAEQEAWLAQELKTSAASGKKWQVLGNQVTMAKVKMPDLQKLLPADKYAQVSQGAKRFYSTARWGLEWNLDAWAGFPAARERLYASAKAANARLITLTGDTHTSWANELHDASGQKRGVEFGCTSVTSNGAGDNVPFEELNWMMPEANDEVLYYNAFSKGFTLLTLKADQVEAEFVKVAKSYSQRQGISYATWREVGVEASVLKAAGISRSR